MDEKIIGIDHGFGYTKTASCIFKSGIEESFIDPPFSDHVLKFKNLYYIVGEKRKAFTPDKINTIDYYILTLAAIAEEIEKRKWSRKNISLTLAVGLPLDYLKAQQMEFKRYLLQKEEVFFTYENKDYLVMIKGVHVYPQGYSAAIRLISSLKFRTHIIDVGTGTVDILPTENGVPIVSGCESIELGVLQCINRIQKNFRRTYGFQLEEYFIQDYLQEKDVSLSKEHKELLQKTIHNYLQDLFMELRQRKIDIQFHPVIICGGGAKIVKKYGKCGKNVTFIEDIHANAKGYEFLSQATLKNNK